MARPSGKPNQNPKRPVNRQRLTDRFVQTIKPGPERITIYDQLRPGLALRVEPSGARSWKFTYRFGGRPRWYTIGRVDRVSLKDARDRARLLDGEVARNIDPQAEKRSQRLAGTFRELVEAYLIANDDKKSIAQYKAQLDRWALPRWSALPAAGITRRDVRALVDQRGRTAPVSASLLLASISAVFRWAMKNDVLDLLANPCRGIETAKAKVRERVLSDIEVPVFWREFDDEDLLRATALRALLLTGQRPGEIRHMRWSDIEVGPHAFDNVTRTGKVRQVRHDGAWWHQPGDPDGEWPGTKNKQSHKVWLTLAALFLLDEADDGCREGFVFKTPRGKAISGLDAAMRSICHRLKIADTARPHDLRRTHGTITTRLGFTRDAMNRIQNHKEGGIGSVYDQNEYADEARRIQTAVGQRIALLVEGAVGGIVDLAAEKVKRA